MIEKLTAEHQRHVLGLAVVILSSVAAGVSVPVMTYIWGVEPLPVLALMLTVAFWFVLLRYFEFALALLMIGLPFYVLLFNLLGISTASVSTFIFYFWTSTAAFIGAARNNPSHLLLVIKRPAAKFLLLLMGWMGLNWLLFSVGVQDGRDKLIFGLLLMMLPYFSVSLYTLDNLRRLIKSLIAISIILLIISLIAYTLGLGLSGPRFSIAENISPLVLSYPLGAGAVLLLVYAIQQRRLFVTLTVGLALTGAVFVMVLTGSRGPILALALSILAVVFLARFSQRLQMLLVFGLFALVLSLLLPLVPSLSRFEILLPVLISAQETGVVDAQSLDLASAGRIAIWQTSLSNWSENPLTGLGLGNTGNVLYAHNFLLETLVELGVIGFVFLLLLLITASMNLFRMRSVDLKGRILYSTTFALLVYSLTQASLSGRIQTLTLLWVAFGMLNALVLFHSSSSIMSRHKWK